MYEKTIVRDSSTLPTMLLVLFVTLKLVGVIDWSWWWVLSPFWIPLGLVALVAVVAVTVMGIAYYLKRRAARKP